MSPAPWGETSHLAIAVIFSRAHCCLTAAGHCYVMLGTIRFVYKGVNDNSVRRLDHCDFIALRSGSVCPLVCCTEKLNSKLSLNHLQQLIWDQTQTNTRIEHLGHMHQFQQVIFCPSFSTIRSIAFHSSTAVVTMLTEFTKTRWPRRRFSESYAVQSSMKISGICEFRVIMGIMTSLLGCCSSSTLGSRTNDDVKTFATLGFWLHH